MCEVKTCEEKTCEVEMYKIKMCKMKMCEVKTCEVEMCKMKMCKMKMCEVKMRTVEAQINESCCTNSKRDTKRRKGYLMPTCTWNWWVIFKSKLVTRANAVCGEYLGRFLGTNCAFPLGTRMQDLSRLWGTCSSGTSFNLLLMTRNQTREQFRCPFWWPDGMKAFLRGSKWVVLFEGLTVRIEVATLLDWKCCRSGSPPAIL